MKLLVPIDQRASIAAGHEAPHSTRTIDVPVQQIPQKIRAYIAQIYDPGSGMLENTTVPLSIQVENPKATMPLTVEKAVDWLTRVFEAHQGAILSRSSKLKDVNARKV